MAASSAAHTQLAHYPMAQQPLIEFKKLTTAASPRPLESVGVGAFSVLAPAVGE